MEDGYIEAPRQLRKTQKRLSYERTLMIFFLKTPTFWKLFHVVAFVVHIFCVNVAFSMNQERGIPNESLSRIKEIVNNELNIQYPTFNGTRDQSSNNENGGSAADLHSINEQVEQLGKVLSSLQKHVSQKIAMRESEEKSAIDQSENEKLYRKGNRNNSNSIKKNNGKDDVFSSENPEDNDLGKDKLYESSNDRKNKKDNYSKKKNAIRVAKSSSKNSGLKIYTVKKNINKSQLTTNSYLNRNNKFHHVVSGKNNEPSHKLKVSDDNVRQYVIKSYAALDTSIKSQNTKIATRNMKSSKECISNPHKSLLNIENKNGKYTIKGEYFSNGDCSNL